jgi:hypothetical protein
MTDDSNSMTDDSQQTTLLTRDVSGFGGQGVSVVPKFAGSNPAEAVRFLRAEKSSARLPSEGK